MKKIIIFCFIFVALLATGALAWDGWHGRWNLPWFFPQQPRMCTMEARLCPDGSAVGRTGPNCEFAPCPNATSTPGDGGLPTPSGSVVALGQRILNNGVYITPLEVLEDSRCPVDVQCIQAGTVRLRTDLTNVSTRQTVILTLNNPTTFAGQTVVLKNVFPAHHSKLEIKPSDYRFEISVTRMPVLNSGISGTVTLGPTCPVQRIPPDPSCADRPYSTRLEVTTADTSRVVKQFTSDQNGQFKVALPPGEYLIRSAAGTNIYPRCSSNGPIVVAASGYTDAAISCDTGIR